MLKSMKIVVVRRAKGISMVVTSKEIIIRVDHTVDDKEISSLVLFACAIIKAAGAGKRFSNRITRNVSGEFFASENRVFTASA